MLAQKVRQVTGVGDVTVGGGSLPAVRVELDPRALTQYGISLEDVRRTIQQANILRPKGSVEEGDRYWQIQASDQLTQASDYAPLIVTYRNGAPVRLSDVAKVTDGVEDRFNTGFYNNKPAVLLIVSRQPDANIIKTVDAINEQLPTLRAFLPAGAHLDVASDRSPSIRATLRDAERTLLIAVALVILVVLLFLASIRAAIIPVAAVPVSLIGSFAVMYFWGFSLNNLSLMALIVATGLVVDDAIVVLENIQRHVEKRPASGAGGDGRREGSGRDAALDEPRAGRGVRLHPLHGRHRRAPVPRVLDHAGRGDRHLARRLADADADVVRALAAASRQGAQLNWFQRLSEGGFSWLLRGYDKTLGWALSHAPLVICLLLGVMALNVRMYIQAPKSFLPQQDTGQIGGFIRGDDGMSFQIMQPKIETFRKAVLQDPAVESAAGFIGGGRGINNAQTFVRLKPLAERKDSAQIVVERIRQNMPMVPGANMWLNVEQDIRFGGGGGGGQGQYQYTLLADERRCCGSGARRCANALRELPELTGISDELVSSQQVTLTVDRAAARRLGVEMSTVTQALNNAFGQRQVSTIYNALNQYRVVMEVSPEFAQRTGSARSRVRDRRRPAHPAVDVQQVRAHDRRQIA